MAIFVWNWPHFSLLLTLQVLLFRLMSALQVGQSEFVCVYPALQSQLRGLAFF